MVPQENEFLALVPMHSVSAWRRGLFWCVGGFSMFPSYEEIKQLEGDYNLIPIATEIYADIITPITLLRKLAKIDKNFYLLESVEDGVRQGRYSFLGFNPLLRAVCKDYTVTIKSGGIKKEIKGKGWYDVYKRLDSLGDILEEVKKSVVDTSATNEWNSSKNFSGINGKLDLMAEYVVKIKEDIDNQLSTLDEDVANRIQESNDNINQWMSNRVTIEQLLQQVERLENKLNEVVDSVVSERLPQELTDKYDVNVSRKGWMSDEEIMAALGIPENEWNQYWLNQWLNEWMEMWMEEGLSEGLWEAREQWVNAPVDMQWIAEPTMPMGA